MPHYVDTAIIEGLTDTKSLRTQIHNITLASGVYNIPQDTEFLLRFIGSTAGQIARLPVATNMPVGFQIEVWNSGSEPILFQYQDGSNFFTLAQVSFTKLVLVDNSTANGTWLSMQIFTVGTTSIISYHLTSSVLFQTSSRSYTSVPGFSITPQSGTYAVWFSSSIVISTNNAIASCTVYKDSSPISDSIREATATGSNFSTMLSTQTITQFNGGQTAQVWVKQTSGTLSLDDRSLLLMRLGT